MFYLDLFPIQPKLALISSVMKKRVLIPIPQSDFDPTECAVPWKILSQNGIQIQFSTPLGQKAKCDFRMLLGDGLGPLAPILAADANGKKSYHELENSPEFQNPIPWSEINEEQFDGLILPGGHAPGMKDYLESDILKNCVRVFFQSDKPVGAICHGVVLAARSTKNGESVLKGRKTTALLSTQELLAWSLTCCWLGNYYRTYRQTVEAEVKENLNSPSDFLKGPLPLKRDSLDHLNYGFTVRDRNYLSARWPGDAHLFGTDFLKMLE
jgi:protease I